MKALEDRILSFDDWEQPWKFREFVIQDKTLSDNEISLFNEILEKGGAYELWNDYDIVLGCKASHAFINENYNLADKAIANIVRALSYDWK